MPDTVTGNCYHVNNISENVLDERKQLPQTAPAMKPAVSFSERIKLMLDHVGTVRSLAKVLGKPHTTVIKWIKGAEPYDKTKRELAARTGVSLEWLRGGGGSAKAELAKLDSKKESPPVLNDSGRDWLTQAVDFIQTHGDEDDKKTVEDMIELISSRIARRRRSGGGSRYPSGAE